MTVDGEWPKALTSIQGRLIAHHRERRGLKHAELVAMVNDLGLDMKRTTLINIEQGRRKTITVPEVFAFAYALQVPPILLLIPLGNVDQVEILKGKTVSPWTAAKWVEGRTLLDEPIDGVIPVDSPQRASFDALLHHAEILMWHQFIDKLQHEILSLRRRRDESLPAEMVGYDEEIELKLVQLRSWRKRILDSNLIPPAVWPDLAAVYPEIN